MQNSKIKPSNLFQSYIKEGSSNNNNLQYIVPTNELKDLLKTVSLISESQLVFILRFYDPLDTGIIKVSNIVEHLNMKDLQ